jgi:flagellar biosynthetic protein FliP
MRRSLFSLLLGVLLLAALALPSLAQVPAADGIPVGIKLPSLKQPQETAASLQMVGILTVLAVAPAILMMLTSFTRIVIVLGLTRYAMGTQQLPPNQVLMGLALCLTFFTMQPVLAEMNTQALQPYLAKRLSPEKAVDAAMPPLRRFMLKQTREADLALFVEMSRIPRPRTVRDVPTYVVVPAFVISELKTGFTMGFVIMLPFLVIDLVVSLILMSMGMMMVPPMQIALPFKILLFVLIDGWNLLARALALSF